MILIERRTPQEAQRVAGEEPDFLDEQPGEADVPKRLSTLGSGPYTIVRVLMVHALVHNRALVMSSL